MSIAMATGCKILNQISLGSGENVTSELHSAIAMTLDNSYQFGLVRAVSSG